MPDDTSPAFLTKTIVPRRRPGTIRRARLLELLMNTGPGTIAVIQAPAGYGKTTLLIDACQEAPADIAWLSLDEWDNDLTLLVQYLRLALGLPRASRGAPDDLHGAITSMVRRIEQSKREVWLVLDDLHTVDQSPDVANFLDEVCKRVPPNCRLFIATRTRPPLASLPRLRLTGQVLDLSAQQLAFTPEEVAQYCAANSPEVTETSAVTEMTHGWPAAVALVLQAGGIEPGKAAAPFHLTEYLSSEVFRQITPDLRDFLVGTSVLDTLEPSACCAVLGIKEERATRVLEGLKQLNLPLTPLSGASLRIHPVMREFLLNELASNPANLGRAHKRAGTWCAGSGNVRQAVWHLGQAGQWDSVVRLILDEAPTSYKLGHWHTVMSWLDVLPSGVLQKNPELRLWEARILARLGQIDSALRVVVETLAVTTNEAILSELEAVKAASLRLKGEARAATEAARRALDLAVRGNASVEVLADAHRELGLALVAAGSFEEAIDHLRTSLDIVAHRGDTEGTAFLDGCLGYALGSLGQLADSASYLEQARQKWRQLGNAKELSWVLNNLGMTYWHMGQEELAGELLHECIKTARESGNRRAEAYALDSLADIERDSGSSDTAAARYREALELAGELGEMTLSTLALLGLADLERRAGRTDRAEGMARQALASAEARDSVYERALASAALGRIARPADPDQAARFFSRAAEMFEQANANRELAETLLLLADSLLPYRQDRTDLRLTLARLPALIGNRTHGAVILKRAREVPQVLQYAVSRNIERKFYRDLLRQASAPPPGEAVAQQTKGSLPAVDVVALGTLEVSLNGRRLAAMEWESEKARELLLLLTFAGRPLDRDEILDALWPEKDRSKSINILHTSVWRVRRALYKEFVVVSRGVYRLNPSGVFTSDVGRFRVALAGTRGSGPGDDAYIAALSRAVEIYGGPFALAIDAEWADDLRRRLEEQYLEAAARLAAALAERGAYSQAGAAYERILATDPLNEPACYGAMQCQLALRNPEVASKLYRRYRATLEAELGQKPGTAVEELYRKSLGSRSPAS